jgi:hypothetical protein
LSVNNIMLARNYKLLIHSINKIINDSQLIKMQVNTQWFFWVDS